MDEVFVTVGNRFEMANGGVRLPGNKRSEDPDETVDMKND